MIKIFLFIIFSVPLLLHAEEKNSCELTLFPRIFYIENNLLSSKDLIKETNCPDTIIEELLKLAQTSHGQLSQEKFNQILNQSENNTLVVKFNPSRIIINSLQSYILENINPSTRSIIKDFTLHNGKNSIGLEQNEIFTFNCQACDGPGEKHLLFEIKDPIKNISTKYWGKGNLLSLTKVIVAKENYGVNQKNLAENQFESKFQYTMKPENYYSEIDKISYYKLNRPIRKNEALLNSELVPLYLVKIGVPTEVTFNDLNLKIIFQGNPLSNAKLDELVQIRNPKSNKIISGRVVDFNKVKVEL